MNEEDIRPEKLFKQYLELAEKDAQDYFCHAPYYYISCPACGSEGNHLLFRKMMFDYVECDKCRTLYVNPRPHEEAFNAYYTDSPSVRFWATNFYKETEKSRRERLIKPKAAMIKQYVEKYFPKLPENSCVIDIGAGYGVFCEELQKIMPDIAVLGIEPAKALQEVCRNKGIKLIPRFLEDVESEDLLDYNVLAAVSFELLEHLHDPGKFIGHCSQLLKPGSLLIFTTLTWDGFDLQVLRERSNSIHPPHHINFFTKASISRLLENNNLEVCEILTPGKLDIDIVTKQISDVKDPFIRSLIEGSEDVKEMFQQFLRDAKLSSHMMVIARRK